jgi:hypothetical protein
MKLQFRNPKTGKFVKGDTKNLDKTFTKFGSNIIQQARGILSKNKKGSSKLSSNLSYNLKMHKSGLSFSFDFGSSSDYWVFVDEGVKGAGGFKGSGRMRGQGSNFSYKKNGKQPPLSAILPWVKSKGLTGKSQRGIAFAVARSIKQRGLTRTQFITKPIKEQYKKLPDKLTKAFALDLENLLDKAIPKTMNA